MTTGVKVSNLKFATVWYRNDKASSSDNEINLRDLEIKTATNFVRKIRLERKVELTNKVN